MAQYLFRNVSRYNYWDLYLNRTLDDREGYHAYRAIIAYPGQSGMTCGQSHSSSDTDDIAFWVNAKPDTLAPAITAISPSTGFSFEYTEDISVELRLNATDTTGIDKVYANITWNDGSHYQELVMYSGTNKNGRYIAEIAGLVNITRYNVTIRINDT